MDILTGVHNSLQDFRSQNLQQQLSNKEEEIEKLFLKQSRVSADRFGNAKNVSNRHCSSYFAMLENVTLYAPPLYQNQLLDRSKINAILSIFFVYCAGSYNEHALKHLYSVHLPTYLHAFIKKIKTQYDFLLNCFYMHAFLPQLC